MLKRPIPSTKELLPVVGLGSWAQFDVGASSSERILLTEVLKQLALLGCTLIDSSPMYGRSEAVIGELTTPSDFSDTFFYATKVWTSGKQEGIEQMESSMRKMRRDTMDLMQVHNLKDWQIHLSTLRQWKDECIVRYIGITHYTTASHEQLEKILLTEPIDFVQFNYSIGVRNAEKRLLDAAKDKGVAVIINEPFEKGNLFHAVKSSKLPAWASDYNISSWSQFFLSYILSHPAVTCVIPGTSDPKHLIDNIGEGYELLPDEKGRRKMVEFMENSL